MRILVVEDDQLLNKTLSYNLSAVGYSVDGDMSKAVAIRFLEKQDYDLIVLDVNLPDGNGFDICHEVKERRPDTAVIFLTANDMESDMLKGFELGADDYLPKPFHLAELNARIKSVIRRNQHDGEIDIRQGNVRIEPDKYRVFVNNQELELNRKEYDILLYFINRPGHLVNKNTLAESVWGDHIDQVDNFDFI